MAAGGVDDHPLPPPSSRDGLSSVAALPYSVDEWKQFEDQMGCSWLRKDLLASSESALCWKVGRRIARLMEGGCDFKSAVLQEGSKLAASYKRGPVIRDVVELVKTVMFPLDVGADLSLGSRSAAGGEALSKQLKVEALAIHGDLEQPHRFAGVSPMGSDPMREEFLIFQDSVRGKASVSATVAELEVSTAVNVDDLLDVDGPALLGPMGPCSRGSSDCGALVSISPLIEPGCPQPVCENACVSAIEAAVPVTVGSLGMEVTRTEVEALGANLRGEQPGTSLMDDGLLCCRPSALGHGGLQGAPSNRDNFVVEDDVESVREHMGMRTLPVVTSSLEVRGQTSPVVADLRICRPCALVNGDSLGTHSTCGNAGVEVDAECSQARDFLPPVPGVKLAEWVTVATNSRKGKRKGPKAAVLGGESRGLSMQVVVPASSADPFPPLPGTGDGGGAAMAPGSGGSSVYTSDEGMNYTEQKLDGESKFAWKDLMRSNKPVDLGVDLHFVAPSIIDGEPCAVFSADEEAENMVHWQHSLLCYVVGKSPSYYQFCKAVNRLWKPPGGVEVFSRENGLFYCRFSCEEDLCRVIKDGPWYMDGKLIVVKKFLGATNCEEAMLSCIPIWVKLPCLPVQWWSISGVSKVVSPIGHPLYFDVPSASQSRIAYARCCVEVSMDKALPEFVTCVGGDKVKRRQKIAYDWVPKKCSYCKSFGHLVADCENELNKDGAKIQKKNEPGNIKRGGQQLRAHMGKSALQEINGARSIEDDQGEVSIQNILMMGEPKISNPTNDAHSLSIIVEESPEDLAGLGSKGSLDDLSGLGSKGKHLLVGSDQIDHMRDSQQLVSEDEESEKDQVSTSSKEEIKGSEGSEGNYECISIPPCRGGGSDGIDSGNLDNYAKMIPEDSDFIKNNKKKKRIRNKPVPVPPPGSRTTRHNGNIPMLNE